MPVGVLTTRPVPSPIIFTVNVVTLACVNAALTLTDPSSVSVHGPLPEHGPFVQPPKVAMFEGMAVSVIILPAGNESEHRRPPPALARMISAGRAPARHRSVSNGRS